MPIGRPGLTRFRFAAAIIVTLAIFVCWSQFADPALGLTAQDAGDTSVSLSYDSAIQSPGPVDVHVTGNLTEAARVSWDLDLCIDTDRDGIPSNDVDAVGDDISLVFDTAGVRSLRLMISDEDSLLHSGLYPISVTEGQTPVPIIRMEPGIFPPRVSVGVIGGQGPFRVEVAFAAGIASTSPDEFEIGPSDEFVLTLLSNATGPAAVRITDDLGSVFEYELQIGDYYYCGSSILLSPTQEGSEPLTQVYEAPREALYCTLAHLEIGSSGGEATFARASTPGIYYLCPDEAHGDTFALHVKPATMPRTSIRGVLFGTEYRPQIWIESLGENLDMMRRSGINAVEIESEYHVSPSTPYFRPLKEINKLVGGCVVQYTGLTIPDDELRRAVEAAVRRGFYVVLRVSAHGVGLFAKDEAWCDKSVMDYFEEDLDWDSWWGELERLMCHYAALAEGAGADAFYPVVGGQMVHLTASYSTRYAAVIEEIRQVFSGSIIAETDVEEDIIGGYDYLEAADYIGVSRQLPTGDTEFEYEGATLERLAALTQANRVFLNEVLTPLSCYYRAPLVLPEVEHQALLFPSIGGSTFGTWYPPEVWELLYEEGWSSLDSLNYSPIRSFAFQTQGYEALLQLSYEFDEVNWAGFFADGWPIAPANWVRIEDTQIYGTPASQLLATWWDNDGIDLEFQGSGASDRHDDLEEPEAEKFPSDSERSVVADFTDHTDLAVIDRVHAKRIPVDIPGSTQAFLAQSSDEEPVLVWTISGEHAESGWAYLSIFLGQLERRLLAGSDGLLVEMGSYPASRISLGLSFESSEGEVIGAFAPRYVGSTQELVFVPFSDLLKDNGKVITAQDLASVQAISLFTNLSEEACEVQISRITLLDW